MMKKLADMPVSARKGAADRNTGDNTEVNAIPAEVIESGVALNDSTGTAEVNKIPEISGLVSTYYLALNNKNVESIRAISNKLTDQDVR